MFFPECFSFAEEGDALCHGDPKGESLTARSPCDVLDRCAGMAIHLREAGGEVDALVRVIEREGRRFVQPRDEASFLESCDRAIRAWKVVGGCQTVDRPRTPSHRGVKDPGRPKTLRGRRLVKTIGRKHREALALSALMVGGIMAGLAERGHRAARGAALPGQAFLRDRVETSGRVGVYVRALPCDCPVACVYPRTRDCTLEVGLPVAPSNLADAARVLSRKGVTVHPVSGFGAWRSMLRGIEAERVPLALRVVFDVFDVPERKGSSTPS